MVKKQTLAKIIDSKREKEINSYLRKVIDKTNIKNQPITTGEIKC